MQNIIDYNSKYQILQFVLVSIGYWNIFKKCGDKRIYAWIPFAREYHIGLCADKEKEARTYTIIAVLSNIMSVVVTYIDQSTSMYRVCAVIGLCLLIARLIYMIRIYQGLVAVFGRKKGWIWLFLLLEGPTAIIWGLFPGFVPSRQVVLRKKGARISGIDVAAIDDGLTVNINKRMIVDFFRRRYLLRDIHMTIPKGHMVLLLGGSGAGKTTYLNAVTGYEKADAKISLDGRDVYTDYASMKYDIGFVPQQDLMRGDDTVGLTLNDAASLRLPSKVTFMQKRKRVNTVLEEFGLAAVKNNLVEKLSGGQRKRLSIAMEYISDPSLFILDEPDSGLDGVVARGLFEKLRAIADQGKIVIVITHTPDRVIDLFDDVIVLAKDSARTGRLAWYGPVDQAKEFFGKDTMEGILLSINQVEEGGEGRADEFVEKYADLHEKEAG